MEMVLSIIVIMILAWFFVCQVISMVDRPKHKPMATRVKHGKENRQNLR